MKTKRTPPDKSASFEHRSFRLTAPSPEREKILADIREMCRPQYERIVGIFDDFERAEEAVGHA